MTVSRVLPGGGALLASADADLATPADLAASGLDWAVIAAGEVLHLHLGPGAALPPGLVGQAPVWELAAGLIGPLDATLAVAGGPALDRAAVLTPLDGPAAAEAAALARLPVPALEEGAEAIWDRLAHAARRAQALLRERRLIAAALTFRGRGRLIGPVSGDLLIRFGVSTWR